MPAKGATTKVAPVRLPPLPKLRVRRPNQTDANPCMGLMSSVLSMFPYALTSALENYGDHRRVVGGCCVEAGMRMK